MTVLQNLVQRLSYRAVAQDEAKATYAKKISKEESAIDFNQDAFTVERIVRGLNPWPIATTTLNDIKYKVFETTPSDEKANAAPGTIIECNKEGIKVACANGVITLITIQAPGKGQVKAADLARSRKEEFAAGKQFV